MPSCLAKPSSPSRAIQKIEEFQASACGAQSLKTSSYNPGVDRPRFFLDLGDQGSSSAEFEQPVNPSSVGDAKLGQCWLHSWLMEVDVSDPGGWLRDSPGSGCKPCFFMLLTLWLALIAEWLQYQSACVFLQDVSLWIAGVS